MPLISLAMLAGLLFADHDADDRPGQLTATLPFGGVTLIEYQARLLVAAGAAQLIVLVGRLTPELLGALGRIGKRGLAVDAVRSAEEAAAKLHPLARVLMLSDGLITTQEIIDGLATGEGDALLVVAIAGAPPAYERVGGGAAWAGVARLDARRIAEVAVLPRDYDFQSTALRLADQAKAAHVMLPATGIGDGHGIEHSSSAMAERGRAVLAATVADRRNWFNAWLVAPVARLAVPRLIDRGATTTAVGLAGAAAGIVGIGAVGFGFAAAGLVLALIGCLALGTAGVLATLRDEPAAVRTSALAVAAIAGIAPLALGMTIADDLRRGLPAAVALVLVGAIGERAVTRPRRRRWWGGPPAYLLVVTAFTVAGWPLAGLAVAALYAAATLSAAVETLRPAG